VRVFTISRRVKGGVAMLGAALLALLLGGCGTISRDYESAYRRSGAALALPVGLRIQARQAPQALALAERIEARPPTQRHAILALSGGGANGAYGAGVLVGWSQSGNRPRFDVVTGVSTGALAAPFAFLGPDWDDELEHVYADGAAQNLLSWRSLAALVAPSLFGSSSLRRLINDNINPEMLRQIAVEHATGRRLLVVTTNLDTEQPVIWDMGAVAALGGESALSLFRNVLLASASMPGVFSPVLLQGVAPDGVPVEEMHVDGGVNLPFLGVPEALPPANAAVAEQPRRVLYILVNGQISARYQVTRGDMRGILARSFDSWGKASLRAALAENAAYANRNGMDVFITAIPDGVDASIVDFTPDSMRALFQLGRNSAATELVWSRVSAPVAQTPAPAAE
jgi:predicted acylesterase/phospholipase RssA